MVEGLDQYPMRLSATINSDSAYSKKGLLSDYFCIAGGNNSFFKALTIEFFGVILEWLK